MQHQLVDPDRWSSKSERKRERERHSFIVNYVTNANLDEEYVIGH